MPHLSNKGFRFINIFSRHLLDIPRSLHWIEFADTALNSRPRQHNALKKIATFRTVRMK